MVTTGSKSLVPSVVYNSWFTIGNYKINFRYPPYPPKYQGPRFVDYGDTLGVLGGSQLDDERQRIERRESRHGVRMVTLGGTGEGMHMGPIGADGMSMGRAAPNGR